MENVKTINKKYDDMVYEVTDRITDLMEKEKISTYSIEDRLGITRQTFKKVIDGDSPFRLDTLFRLRDILDCSIYYLLGDSEYTTPEKEAAGGLLEFTPDAVDILSDLSDEKKEMLYILTVSGALSDILDDFVMYGKSQAISKVDDVLGNEIELSPLQKSNILLEITVENLRTKLKGIRAMYENHRELEKSNEKIKSLESQIEILEKTIAKKARREH